VACTGFVSAEERLALLRSADLFAMPSEAELQSIATLEAMAVGLPVVAARARALPELVEAGVNGRLFEPGDVNAAACQIEALLAERDRWPDYAAESRRRAAEHALDRTVTQYEAMYAKAQGVRAAPRPLSVGEAWGG
jgi:glycosyltransferase involved in cell wall biosynthesis